MNKKYEKLVEQVLWDKYLREARQPWTDTGCKCTMRERMVGSGCPKCNPEWPEYPEFPETR